MTPERFEDIRADIYAEPWKDPQLFPDLLHKAIEKLGVIATGGVLEVGYERGAPRYAIDCEGSSLQEWAESVLEQMARRARSGVPFGEPEYGDLPPTNPEEL